jgi:tetraacyldisaccharide 4'-kinase
VIRRYTQAPVFYATTRLPNGLAVYPASRPPQEGFNSDRAKLFAFCGIGNPRAFFADLRLWGLKIVGEAPFPDHHRYSQAEADELERKAESAGADALACTEKDTFNLAGVRFSKMPVFWCPIQLELNDADGFWHLVKSRLSRHAKATAA